MPVMRRKQPLQAISVNDAGSKKQTCHQPGKVAHHSLRRGAATNSAENTVVRVPLTQHSASRANVVASQPKVAGTEKLHPKKSEVPISSRGRSASLVKQRSGAEKLAVSSGPTRGTSAGIARTVTATSKLEKRGREKASSTSRLHSRSGSTVSARSGVNDSRVIPPASFRWKAVKDVQRSARSSSATQQPACSPKAKPTSAPDTEDLKTLSVDPAVEKRRRRSPRRRMKRRHASPAHDPPSDAEMPLSNSVYPPAAPVTSLPPSTSVYPPPAAPLVSSQDGNDDVAKSVQAERGGMVVDEPSPAPGACIFSRTDVSETRDESHMPYVPPWKRPRKRINIMCPNRVPVAGSVLEPTRGRLWQPPPLPRPDNWRRVDFFRGHEPRDETRRKTPHTPLSAGSRNARPVIRIPVDLQSPMFPPIDLTRCAVKAPALLNRGKDAPRHVIGPGVSVSGAAAATHSHWSPISDTKLSPVAPRSALRGAREPCPPGNKRTISFAPHVPTPPRELFPDAAAGDEVTPFHRSSSSSGTDFIPGAIGLPAGDVAERDCAASSPAGEMPQAINDDADMSPKAPPASACASPSHHANDQDHQAPIPMGTSHTPVSGSQSGGVHADADADSPCEGSSRGRETNSSTSTVAAPDPRRSDVTGRSSVHTNEALDKASDPPTTSCMDDSSTVPSVRPSHSRVSGHATPAPAHRASDAPETIEVVQGSRISVVDPHPMHIDDLVASPSPKSCAKLASSRAVSRGSSSMSSTSSVASVASSSSAASSSSSSSSSSSFSSASSSSASWAASSESASSTSSRPESGSDDDVHVARRDTATSAPADVDRQSFHSMVSTPASAKKTTSRHQERDRSLSRRLSVGDVLDKASGARQSSRRDSRTSRAATELPVHHLEAPEAPTEREVIADPACEFSFRPSASSSASSGDAVRDPSVCPKTPRRSSTIRPSSPRKSKRSPSADVRKSKHCPSAGAASASQNTSSSGQAFSPVRDVSMRPEVRSAGRETRHTHPSPGTSSQKMSVSGVDIGVAHPLRESADASLADPTPEEPVDPGTKSADAAMDEAVGATAVRASHRRSRSARFSVSGDAADPTPEEPVDPGTKSADAAMDEAVGATAVRASHRRSRSARFSVSGDVSTTADVRQSGGRLDGDSKSQVPTPRPSRRSAGLCMTPPSRTASASVASGSASLSSPAESGSDAGSSDAETETTSDGSESSADTVTSSEATETTDSDFAPSSSDASSVSSGLKPSSTEGRRRSAKTRRDRTRAGDATAVASNGPGTPARDAPLPDNVRSVHVSRSVRIRQKSFPDDEPTSRDQSPSASVENSESTPADTGVVPAVVPPLSFRWRQDTVFSRRQPAVSTTPLRPRVSELAAAYAASGEGSPDVPAEEETKEPVPKHCAKRTRRQRKAPVEVADQSVDAVGPGDSFGSSEVVQPGGRMKRGRGGGRAQGGAKNSAPKKRGGRARVRLESDDEDHDDPGDQPTGTPAGLAGSRRVQPKMCTSSDEGDTESPPEDSLAIIYKRRRLKREL
eukprot:TRINITY_DN806_c0_g1_i1.p1 TRINITY_DN806_c0_g1~~TRINITY_DN806_c0_g1_i1.p1  ORF type:complete len:1527 (+),score=90.14 TRINITY_DN806_c0_g1_i1:117-4697(+)